MAGLLIHYNLVIYYLCLYSSLNYLKLQLPIPPYASPNPRAPSANNFANLNKLAAEVEAVKSSGRVRTGSVPAARLIDFNNS